MNIKKISSLVMSYKITDYTLEKAHKYGLSVKPSTNKKKKIDVYKDDKKIGSVGAIGYDDYPTYIKTKGKSYADNKRRLYKLRHNYDKPKYSNGWLADKLLW